MFFWNSFPFSVIQWMLAVWSHYRGLECKSLDTYQMSINRWMDKQILVYAYEEVLLSIEKTWTIDTCNTGCLWWSGGWESTFQCRDAGSVSGWGATTPLAVGQPSPCTAATEPSALDAMPQLEKPARCNWDPTQPKNKFLLFKKLVKVVNYMYILPQYEKVGKIN